MSLLLCVQFWEGDKVAAFRLARFIADIEPRFRSDVELCFVARYDAHHDHDTLKYVVNKMPVSFHTCSRKGEGWPAGPNAMAVDTLYMVAERRERPEAALLMEPDCVPLARNWIDQLMAEWQARPKHTVLMGSWRDSGGPYGHINGNCMVVPDFVDRVDVSRVPPQLAWDCAAAPQVREKWHISGLFKNCFQSYNATEDGLRTPEVGERPPVVIHGYKDDSAIDIARRWVL